MSLTAALCAASLAGVSLASAAFAQTPIKYPASPKGTTVDTYFGTRVADPYRWLEDQNSRTVASWVDNENKVTFDYLATIPLRAVFREELTKLINVPRVSVPFRVAGKLYFSKNTGLQNQSVVFEQSTLDGPPRMLIDPNKISADGATALVVAIT